ncbi:8-hydroxygeraniol dehydrogenase-like, partial [Carica papaya]
MGLSPEEEHPVKAFGWAARDSSGHLSPFNFSRSYVVRFPDNILLHTAPPLLCAGITVYSPLKYFRLAESEKHVGIVGLGGLGHLAVKFAKVMGAKVTVISSSLSKKIDALERLGADSFLHSSDHDEMQ